MWDQFLYGLPESSKVKMMGIYGYIKDVWKDPKNNLGALYQQRLIQWRTEETTVRLERPTRLDRARALGYKPKQGVFVVRQRVDRGGRMRPQIRHPRKTKNQRRTKIVGMSYQVVAERRAGNKYLNCEVINSYWVGQDGKHFWYEVILADRNSPSVLADKNLKWVGNPANRLRALRGLTAAGKRSRGMTAKGKGSEKTRPSIRSHGSRAH
jgi:large subunit ribosomal protein L15e